MKSQAHSLEEVRANASLLLKAIGISQIVVVDDEYADAVSVEDLLGICFELDAVRAAQLPELGDIPFDEDYGVWSGILRQKWQTMGPEQQAEILRRARVFIDSPEEAASEATRSDRKDVGVVNTTAREGATIEQDVGGDAGAARSLYVLLSALPECLLVTMSLRQWRADREQYLDNPVAKETLFLFDRDFSREDASTDEGLLLIEEVQKRGVAICCLITHTVSLGQELVAWDQLTRDHGLDRDRLLVIAKQRLAMEDWATHYSFLRMVRLAALGGRSGSIKKAAWKIFAESVAAAQDAMEQMSVVDFDQIVLASSRREGVWEPDTLFRVFSVFMRREARNRLYEDSEDVATKIAHARRISSIPVEVEAAFGTEAPCAEAIRVQRFELFESSKFLNRYHIPVDLGDIFEDGNGRMYILLSQPCDLMVRSNGRRSYDDKCTKHVTLAEVIVEANPQEIKPSWAEIAWFNETSGASAYVDFAKSHDVRLAVLDLCVLNVDGAAAIDLGGEDVAGLIEPWKKHYLALKKQFKGDLRGYRTLCKSRGVSDRLKRLALRKASLSVNFEVSVDGNLVTYDVRRVNRLNQPRAGALLTSFARFRSRAAFEHDLDHRMPPTDSE